jgi:hypothetical protein
MERCEKVDEARSREPVNVSAAEIPKEVVKAGRRLPTNDVAKARSFLDDSVPMQVFVRKGEENVQRCGGKWRVLRVIHCSRIPTTMNSD